SIMQYYRKSVIGRIEYHIRQFDLNFTEIADLFNFSSIHYFSKFYKRETGITPREYLKSSREK
ncbi:MAG: AraC family transcriptional regulator, partial [Oscillospiraceae bacterium]